MAELKTKPTDASVVKFINSVGDTQKREDSFALIEIMSQITKQPPKMWGPTIVGFGVYHYKYESGHEGDMCLTGFSPRKAALTLYVMPGFQGYSELMKTLGKYKAGKACIYVKRLDDLHLPTLKKLIRESVKCIAKKKWP
jgi:hypothetical protein